MTEKSPPPKKIFRYTAQNFLRLCPCDESWFPSGCVLSFVSCCMWALPLITTCSTWHINSRIYWISLIHHQCLILQSYLMLWYPLFNENITPVLIWLKRANVHWSDTRECVYAAVKEKHWWGDCSLTKCCTSGVCEWLRQRGPHMGDAWEPFFVQKRWSRASLFFFFFRGNSSCLAALIQAGW